MVEFLLKTCKLDLNKKDVNGRTSLFFAAARGHCSIALVLISNGAKLYLKDRKGSTPLFAAVRNGHQRIAKELLNLGRVSIEFEDDLGRTLLWWAKKTGNVNITQLMLGAAQTMNIEPPTSHPSMECSPMVAEEQSEVWCDVCTRHARKGRLCYGCMTCENGGFCICVDCSEAGAKCHDASHEWTVEYFDY